MYLPPNSYKRIYSIDFTAQTTQNLITGGDFTIDGRTWTVENETNSSSFSLTNGSGLVITTIDTVGAYQPDARDAALIRTDLSGLVPSISFAECLGLRLRTRVLMPGITDSFQFSKMALEWATHPTWVHMAPGRGYHLTTIKNQDQIVAVTSAPASDISSRTAADVTADDIIELIWNMDWTQDQRHSLYTTDFPVNSSYNGTMSTSLGTNIMQDSVVNHPRLVLLAQPTGGLSFTATFTHLQIDQRIS